MCSSAPNFTRIGMEGSARSHLSETSIGAQGKCCPPTRMDGVIMPSALEKKLVLPPLKNIFLRSVPIFPRDARVTSHREACDQSIRLLFTGLRRHPWPGKLSADEVSAGGKVMSLLHRNPSFSHTSKFEELPGSHPELIDALKRMGLSRTPEKLFVGWKT